MAWNVYTDLLPGCGLDIIIITLLVVHNVILLYYSLQTSFYIDWEPPAVGILHKNGTRSESKGDFAISLEVLVEAGTNTGYLVKVKRGIDGKSN